MQTIEEFYDFMQRLHTTRQAITGSYVARTNDPYETAVLQNALKAIDNLPGTGVNKTLEIGGEPTEVTLDYERRELERDIFFLEHSVREFQEYLAKQNENFASEVADTVSFLRDKPINTFITDRDGTINNYCGHYRSSHQPVYNAVFLTQYVRSATQHGVVLTSAPLDPHGILDLNAVPERTVSLAGSKGREYLSVHGKRGAMEIPARQKEQLDRLNSRIAELLEQDDYKRFSVIGSGVQYKFGQTTIARQDIHDSISPDESKRFLQTVKNLVREQDAQGEVFQIEDTGKDIEIMLTIEGNREFSKGDGIGFLADELSLPLSQGMTLICGDTASDVPMVERAVDLTGATNTAAIFVTDDDDLKAQVSSLAKEHWFVSSPDVLVTALYKIGQEVEA